MPKFVDVVKNANSTTNLTGEELFPIVQNGLTKKISIAELQNGAFSAATSPSVLHSVIGAPTNTVGNDGDYAIDIYYKFFYGPKTNGVWPLGFSMVGEQGATGANGADGAAGLSYVPEGYGFNYQIVSSIATDDLTVAIKNFAGNDPSSGDPSVFNIGLTQFSLQAALSVTITDAMGDVFSWDAGKIQGNDAQLFVYAINNNGTLQIGVSPCPTLLTVTTNYYDAGGQTGSAGHTNVVMSGTRHATNICRVIGRINVKQADNNTWVSPGTALVINHPIWVTDWLYYAPTYGGFSAAPSGNISIYKVDRKDLLLTEREPNTGTSNDTVFTITCPIKSVNLTNMYWYIALVSSQDAGSVVSTPHFANLAANSQTINIYKSLTGTAWTNSGNKKTSFTGFRYQIS